MAMVINFGEMVEGYDIPVLNEREVRASAGILFLFIALSISRVAYAGDFLLLKYFVIFFLSDFIIRVFVNPRYSPTLILGRLIVSNQTPEYVGAAQKRFAWKIGLGLASVIFSLLVVVNAHSFITGSACIICLGFLFFESAFGICLGCLFYNWLHKEKPKYCPGEVCKPLKKADIQKTSWTQIAIILVFISCVAGTTLLFNDVLARQPENLWALLQTTFQGGR